MPEVRENLAAQANRAQDATRAVLRALALRSSWCRIRCAMSASQSRPPESPLRRFKCSRPQACDRCQILATCCADKESRRSLPRAIMRIDWSRISRQWQSAPNTSPAVQRVWTRTSTAWEQGGRAVWLSPGTLAGPSMERRATRAKIAAHQRDVALPAVDFALIGDHAELAVAGLDAASRRLARCSAHGAAGSGSAPRR